MAVAALAVAVVSGCTMKQKSAEPQANADLLNQKIDEALAAATSGARYAAPNVDVDFTLVGFDALDGWTEDDHGAALVSFQRSCDRLNRLDRTTVLGGLASRIEDWRPSCEAAKTVSPDAARAFFELAFTPVRLDPDNQALVTSYYEPELPARRRPSDGFATPIYAKPPEVVFADGDYGVRRGGGVSPFFTRGEIYAGAIDGRGLEIAYLADPVDAFFLQIQGSGRLRFEDGSTMRVGFAAKNGHPYKSAAQEMINRGLATRATASAGHIKKFVRKNPTQGMEILSANPAYVFFREITDLDLSQGPIGALGVSLTPGRSIAVDRKYTPLAAPVWLETPSPVGDLRRLVVAQDTGSAILGAQRADYFWGTGDEAGRLAGQMSNRGRITVLLPTATVKRLTAPSS